MNIKKSKVEFPTYFLNNGKYVCGVKNIADKFNVYFTEIGPSLASEIDVSNKSPFNTYLTSPCTSSFYFQYTNPSGILKIIQGLKPKTSAGYDHLSSKVLKDIADVVSIPLSIIINQSVCSGIFPSKLKIAKVIPLFKKGDIKLFGNYRQISLLSSVSKVFEKAAYGQLYEYFSSHALFYDSQYGFRKYHSTELAALELVDRIHKEIDENKIPFSVFLDLSKAFDTLDHDILLHKLQYYGITGTALDWFRSYLTERYQYVDYNGASSSMKFLTTGVPLGSILGPLLFMIYMNDIHTVSNNLNFILYADDTTLTSPLCSFTYGGYHDINRVSTLINSEITKISEWLSVNKLFLNANKLNSWFFTTTKKSWLIVIFRNLKLTTPDWKSSIIQFSWDNDKWIHELGITLRENC